MSIFSSLDNPSARKPLENLHFVEQIARLIPGVLLVIDVWELNIVFINKYGAKTLYSTEEEIYNKKKQIFKRWIHPEDYGRFIKQLGACKNLADGEERQIELRLKLEENCWHWFCMKNVAFSYTETGEVSHILSLGQDIQIQKDAEKQAEDEQRRFKDAQAIGHIGSFEAVLPANNVKWSDEVYRIHGLASQNKDITEKVLFSLVHPDDQQALLAAIDKLHATGESVNLVTRIVRSDGSIRHIHRRAELIQDTDGQPKRIYGTLQDITEQVAFENKHKAQSALLLEAEKVGSFGSYIIDIASMQIKFSDGMYRVLGHEPQSYVPSMDLIDANSHPDDATTVRLVLEQAAIHKKPYQYTRRIYLPDGQMRHMLSQGRVITDDKGEAIQFLGIVRDVTEQKQAEEEIKQKNELLEGVLNAPNVGITVFKSVRNASGEIVDFEFILMSKLAMQHAAGYHLLGKQVHEVSAITREQFQVLQNVVETGSTTEHEVHLVQGKNERWYYNSCARFGDGVVMVWEDTTKRKQAEEKLKESMHFVRQVTDTTPDIMFVYDIEVHQLVYLNRDIEALTGFKPEEFEKLDQDSLDKFIFPEDLSIVTEYHKGFQSAEDNEIREIEFRLKNSQDDWCWFQIRGRVFKRNGSGKVVQYLSIMRDITAQKKTQDELIEAEKLSVQGGMARTLAHEVRGPAANIGLSLDLLKNELGATVEIPEEINVYFDIIEKSCNRITNYITKLLNIPTTKPEDYVALDLPTLLEEALESAQDRIYLHGVKVHKHLDKGIEISANSDRLKIALLNIIINAIEAMQEQEGVLQLSLKDEGNTCSLTVQDNGSGMSADQTKKMFDAYYTSKPNGLGVGLANVKTILQEHNAEISVKSILNVGTAFTITFPKR